MAQLMPCLVGALACLACWEALWCMQHHAPAAGVRAHGPEDAALGALAGVGAFALRRVPAANVLGRYAQELAEMLRPRWQVSGNSLVCTGQASAQLNVNISGTKFLRINNSSTLLDMRADGITAADIEVYGAEHLLRTVCRNCTGSRA